MEGSDDIPIQHVIYCLEISIIKVVLQLQIGLKYKEEKVLVREVQHKFKAASTSPVPPDPSLLL